MLALLALVPALPPDVPVLLPEPAPSVLALGELEELEELGALEALEALEALGALGALEAPVALAEQAEEAAAEEEVVKNKTKVHFEKKKE